MFNLFMKYLEPTCCKKRFNGETCLHCPEVQETCSDHHPGEFYFNCACVYREERVIVKEISDFKLYKGVPHDEVKFNFEDEVEVFSLPLVVEIDGKSYRDIIYLEIDGKIVVNKRKLAI